MVPCSLPTGNVSYSAVLDSDGDGVEMEYFATGFFNTDGTTENPSQMTDMGRFMQRVEVPQVTYDGRDELTGSVQGGNSTEKKNSGFSKIPNFEYFL